MKILRLIIVCLTLVFALILWLTRTEWLQSQSAFALSDNVIWYYLMHICIITTFGLDGIVHKRLQSYTVSLAGIGIVIFDMYNYPNLHNIFTALTFILALFNIIYYSENKLERKISIFHALAATVYFGIGIFMDFHLFLAESIVEGILSVNIIRRILRL